MSIWPELRASFRACTGRDLAKGGLDEFLEHTLWYMINTPDAAPQRREALMKALVGELVEGGEFKDHATSMIDSGALDAFERERTGQV
jgi:hypothetical protein